MMNNKRNPSVAGQFYSKDKEKLLKSIEKMLSMEISEKVDALACVSPHAGYMYSGAIAAFTLSKVNYTNSCIIIGPNHTGFGKNFSVYPEGFWITPLGEIEIDEELARRLIKKSNYLEEDFLAHKLEHSIEVQLPFIQYFKPDIKFVPIIIGKSDKKSLFRIGKEIAEVIKDLKQRILIIASSDMTHYEPHEETIKKDMRAIDKILKLDYEGLLEEISSLEISMCGYAPVAISIVCSGLLGAKKAELIKYATSGDITGDFSSVVGYAGIIIR